MSKKSLMLIFLLTLLTQSIISLTDLVKVDVSASQLPKLYVNPPSIVDTTLTAGTKFNVTINVADITELNPLFAYTFKLWWDRPLLNWTKVIQGTDGTDSFLQQGGDTSFYAKKYQTQGYIYVSATLQAPYTPVTGSGLLVTTEFLVEQLGITLLKLNETQLLKPPIFPGGDPIPFDSTAENGYFSNIIPGDINIDGKVTAFDVYALGRAYGTKQGIPNWNPNADIDKDLVVGTSDLGILSKNYGKTT